MKPTLLVGQEISFLRKAMLLKTTDLARTIGVEPETLSRWENNKARIGIDKDRFLRCLAGMSDRQATHKLRRTSSSNLGRVLTKYPQKLALAIFCGHGQNPERLVVPPQSLRPASPLAAGRAAAVSHTGGNASDEFPESHRVFCLSEGSAQLAPGDFSPMANLYSLPARIDRG